MAVGFEGKVADRKVVQVKNIKGHPVPFYQYKLEMAGGKFLEFLNDSLYLPKNSSVILRGVFRQHLQEKLKILESATLVYSDVDPCRGSQKIGEKRSHEYIDGIVIERVNTFPNSTTKHIYFDYKIQTHSNDLVIVKASTRVLPAGSEVSFNGTVKKYTTLFEKVFSTTMVECEFTEVFEPTK